MRLLGAPHLLPGGWRTRAVVNSRWISNKYDGVMTLRNLPAAIHHFSVVEVNSQGVTKKTMIERAELTRRFGLGVQDFRALDPALTNQIPTMLAKKSFFALNLGIIRCLCVKDRALFFEGTQIEAEKHANAVKEAIGRKENAFLGVHPRIPFGLRVIDTCLNAVSEDLNRQCRRRIQQVEAVCQRVTEDPRTFMLGGLLPLKKRLTKLEFRVREIESAIATCLESDEDLDLISTVADSAGYYKTPDHRDLELLLEMHDRQLVEVLNEVTQMKEHLNDAQQETKLAIARIRNEVLIFNLHWTIVTVCCGVTAASASIFGMNLTSGLEENPTMFATVTVANLGMTLAVGAMGYFQTRHVRFNEEKPKDLSLNFYLDLDDFLWCKYETDSCVANRQAEPRARRLRRGEDYEDDNIADDLVELGETFDPDTITPLDSDGSLTDAVQTLEVLGRQKVHVTPEESKALLTEVLKVTPTSDQIQMLCRLFEKGAVSKTGVNIKRLI
eukprot:Rmarinus@m.22679